jgi:hypothetical protein
MTPFSIDLTGQPVTDKDIGSLRLSRCLNCIECLNLSDTNLTDDGLKIISTLPRLYWLQLRNTQVTENGLNALSGAPSLEMLEISGTSIDDQAIPILASFRKLKHLLILRTRITDDGLQKLRESMPDCKIYESSESIFQ